MFEKKKKYEVTKFKFDIIFIIFIICTIINLFSNIYLWSFIV